MEANLENKKTKDTKRGGDSLSTEQILKESSGKSGDDGGEKILEEIKSGGTVTDKKKITSGVRELAKTFFKKKQEGSDKPVETIRQEFQQSREDMVRQFAEAKQALKGTGQTKATEKIRILESTIDKCMKSLKEYRKNCKDDIGSEHANNYKKDLKEYESNIDNFLNRFQAYYGGNLDTKRWVKYYWDEAMKYRKSLQRIEEAVGKKLPEVSQSEIDSSSSSPTTKRETTIKFAEDV